MKQKQIANSIISPTELAAKFAAGKIPTESAFHTLVEWACEWQSLFGWNGSVLQPGPGFQMQQNRVALKVGAGLNITPAGLAVKRQPNGGINSSDDGLALDASTAVNAAAFAGLPESERKAIASCLAP